MNERMLDKQHEPSIEEFENYCGETKALFVELNAYLVDEFKTERLLRFPYGNSYGWAMKYSQKKKLVCDVFAENGSFTVMIRLSGKQLDSVYNEASDYTKAQIDNKYPCGDGGWLHYRISTKEHLVDIKKLLSAKLHK